VRLGWIPGQRRIEGLGKPSRMLTAGFKDAMYGGKRELVWGFLRFPFLMVLLCFMFFGFDDDMISYYVPMMFTKQ
jgi:hypothetical protein